MAKKDEKKNEEVVIEQEVPQPEMDSGEGLGEMDTQVDDVNPTTEIVNWEEKMLADAENVVVTEVTADITAIATRSGLMRIDGTPVPGNKILAVIVSSIYANLYYNAPFMATEMTPPACYAYGDLQEGMRPVKNAADKQAEECATCPQNQWGTADVGRGKACANKRKLALIIVGKWDPKTEMWDIKENAAVYKGQLYSLMVPPTSIKAYSKYVKAVADIQKRPPYGVLTEIELEPDDKDQFHINFTFNDKVAVDEDGNSIEDAGEILKTLIDRQYAASEYLKMNYADFEPAASTNKKY